MIVKQATNNLTKGGCPTPPFYFTTTCSPMTLSSPIILWYSSSTIKTFHLKVLFLAVWIIISSLMIYIAV